MSDVRRIVATILVCMVLAGCRSEAEREWRRRCAQSERAASSLRQGGDRTGGPAGKALWRHGNELGLAIDDAGRKQPDLPVPVCATIVIEGDVARLDVLWLIGATEVTAVRIVDFNRIKSYEVAVDEDRSLDAHDFVGVTLALQGASEPDAADIVLERSDWSQPNFLIALITADGERVATAARVVQ